MRLSFWQCPLEIGGGGCGDLTRHLLIGGCGQSHVAEITSGSSFEPNNLTEQKLGYVYEF